MGQQKVSESKIQLSDFFIFIPHYSSITVDGLAFVSIGGKNQVEILEFISYEGNLRAVNGSAKGIRVQ